MDSIKLVIAICGASGSMYALRLIRALMDHSIEIHIIISHYGRQVLCHETNYNKGPIQAFIEKQWPMTQSNHCFLTEHDENNMFASPASGSFKHHGMIIIPCSMKTISAIANGYSDNLIHRSADVCLKEKRQLIILPRETPLNDIHLKNMLKLSRSGATIMPLCPGFYTHPKTLEDVIQFMVGKIFDQLNIDHNFYQEWQV